MKKSLLEQMAVVKGHINQANELIDLIPTLKEPKGQFQSLMGRISELKETHPKLHIKIQEQNEEKV